MPDLYPVQPPQENNPQLKLRRDGGGISGDVRTCPSCKSVMAEGAILCLQCGFNISTGKRMRGARESAQLRRAVKLAFVGALVAAGCLLAPKGWSWYNGRLETAKNGRITYVTNLIQEKAPLCSVGETVTLRRVDGATCSGLLCGHGPGGVLMESAKGQPFHVVYDHLDIWTKMRFDAQLRAHIIEINSRLPSNVMRLVPLLFALKSYDWELVLEEPKSPPKACALCQGMGVVDCPDCGGRGVVMSETSKPCTQCGGTGLYAPKIGTGKTKCPFCRGSGQTPDSKGETCATCKGTGRCPCPQCRKPEDTAKK